MQSLSIHSHKGGVGKSTISVNKAVLLAKQGYNVCLLDNDFSGPALFTFFDNFLKNKNFEYINKYFENKANLNEVLLDLSEDLNLKGKLWIGLADPTPASVDRMLRLDEKGASRMLAGLAKLKRDVAKEPYNTDYLIIDAAAGLGLTTINSFVNSQIILFVLKVSNADIIGTVNMIAGLIEELGRRITMVANQIPIERISTVEKKIELENLISNKINEVMENNSIEFLGWLPTDPELQKLEFDEAINALKGGDAQRKIFTLDQPDHPFTGELKRVSQRIFGGE